MSEKTKRILITGAAGTVGLALARRYLSDGCHVCLFDSSEDGLFRAQRSLTKYHNLARYFLGDVRDLSRLYTAFRGVDTVFHCAAKKHVALSEYNMQELINSNIVGVQNVIDASIASNVHKTIFTSSDKAVNPTSAMGVSKLFGEKLITNANLQVGSSVARFCSVRFGNVLNSNGSVLPIFYSQQANQRPFTITHEDMTRFFIRISDAIELCTFAERNVQGGEIFIKIMPGFKVKDLALAIHSGDSFEFVTTGMLPGEKLYEELITEFEKSRTFIDDGYIVVIPEYEEGSRYHFYEQLTKKYHIPFTSDIPIRSDYENLSVEQIKIMIAQIGQHSL